MISISVTLSSRVGTVRARSIRSLKISSICHAMYKAKCSSHVRKSATSTALKTIVTQPDVLSILYDLFRSSHAKSRVAVDEAEV